MAIITDEKVKKIEEQIIPKDDQKQIILGMIDGGRKEIFNNTLMERYFTRRAILQPSYQTQLGNVQKGIKDSKLYLKFLEDILKDEY